MVYKIVRLVTTDAFQIANYFGRDKQVGLRAYVVVTLISKLEV
jgi:hypothetical protein